jgi:hypothetical protein
MTTNFKPPKGSGRLERHERRKSERDALADAYAEVDARDASICAVTGRFTKAGAVDARVRREHHHLKGRNVRPDWVTKPRRIITVCAEAHALIEGGFIQVEGDDATKPLFFHWNTEMMRGRLKPFRIVSKRAPVEEEHTDGYDFD